MAVTQITSLDDFQLLIPDQDILMVNGVPCLFEGMRHDQPVVLRRIDDQTASEMFLNPEKISFRDGRISAVGECAYATERYSLYGEQTYSKENSAWLDRNYFEETKQRLQKLQGAKL